MPAFVIGSRQNGALFGAIAVGEGIKRDYRAIDVCFLAWSKSKANLQEVLLAADRQ